MEANMANGRADTTNLDDNVWTVRHCAAYVGVGEQWYRRNILIRADHPQGLNPGTRRLSFFKMGIRPWLDSLMQIEQAG
jgi:hypothetical protein